MDTDDDERDHWWTVMRTFLHYVDFVETEIERRQKHINRLSHEHSHRLPNITFEKLAMIQQAADVNQQFFEEMVRYHASNSFLEPPQYAVDKAIEEDGSEVSADGEDGGKPRNTAIYPRRDVGPPVDIRQHHRNNAVLHSLFREWSAEGAQYRDQSFGALLRELQERLPITEETAHSHRVLVPGCGLGRLPLEIASKGYCCEGNEFSA